jgi:hypothetical protein
MVRKDRNPAAQIPDIVRLLEASRAVRTLIERVTVTAGPDGFPRTRRALDAFAAVFEAELESNLLRAYEAMPVPKDDMRPARRARG